VKDFNAEPILYDSSIHDFFQTTEEVIKICGFYLNFQRSGEKSNISVVSKGNQAFVESFDRESLFYEVLSYEAKFQLAKAKLVMLYYNLLKNCLVYKKRRRLLRVILELQARRPVFDISTLSIFEVWAS
jgi:hypothetical protein